MIYWVDLLAMIYYVGIILFQYSVKWSNSAVRFGRMAVYFRPSGYGRLGQTLVNDLANLNNSVIVWTETKEIFGPDNVTPLLGHFGG